jgi:hypothetical protein
VHGLDTVRDSPRSLSPGPAVNFSGGGPLPSRRDHRRHPLSPSRIPALITTPVSVLGTRALAAALRSGLPTRACGAGGVQVPSRGACCARPRRRNVLKPRIQCVLTQWMSSFIAFRAGRNAFRPDVTRSGRGASRSRLGRIAFKAGGIAFGPDASRSGTAHGRYDSAWMGQRGPL